MKTVSKIKMVLLDAGHGGIINGEYVTAGKRSPKWADGSQYFEGVGNRLIREELAKMLRAEGIRYKFVNEGEADTSLKTRVDFANSQARKYGAGNTLLISIHSNGFHDQNANGWECFTTPNKTNSDQYAEVLYNKMRAEYPNERFRTDYSDGDQDKEAYFYVIRKTICPAILSENFFHTNPRECQEILMCKHGRRKIAKAHLEMIKEFI
jgi:N-acetylmuramoyl-L-alanine amidase